MQQTYILLTLLFLLSCTNQQLSPYEHEIREYRRDYLQSFLNEERSPLEKRDLKNLSFYQADSNFLITANYTLLNDEFPTDFPTSSGKNKSYRKFALLEFEVSDKSEELYVYESMQLADKEEYKDYLFLPFTDLTSGEQTYGGGRYLDLSRQDFKNGKVLIDFNKCYNPWCAYSIGYSCPVPPKENDLEVAITAGEMNYSGTYKSQLDEQLD